jgi:hypothetical protein
MWAHPGKKLLFMGGEIGQWNEWNHDTSLDWGLLDFPLHAGVRDLIRDLNGIYRSNPALHQVDFEPAGFEWIAADDAECSVVAFVRWARDRSRAILYVGNFTPVVRHGYRIGVPMPGIYQERLNTDSQHYGGSNVGNGFEPIHAEQVSAHGREWSLESDAAAARSAVSRMDTVIDGAGLEAGRPWPLGAHWDGRGVNFALFRRMPRPSICVSRRQADARVALRECTDQVWHGYLAGAVPGLRYALPRAWSECARTGPSLRWPAPAARPLRARSGRPLFLAGTG